MISYKKIEDLLIKTKKYIEDKGYPLSYIYYDPNNQKSSKTIEKFIEDVGYPISTEILYNKPNVVLPQYVKYTISDYGKDILSKIENIKVEKIKISEIYITQKFIFSKPLLKKHLSLNKYIPLFLYENKYYVNDGNHYIAYAFLNGDEYINAKVIVCD